MTGTAKSIAPIRTVPADTARPSLLQRLIAWNQAWCEVQHVRRLDAAALRDAGLTEQQRDEISVRQILGRAGH